MAGRAVLDAWLYGTRIGVLSEPKYGKLRFDFTEDAEDRFRLGSSVLSVSMPVDARQRPRGDLASHFFDGLLPEGKARDSITTRFSLQRGDDYGLLAAIGRESAGALIIWSQDVPLDTVPIAPRPLHPGELERLISELDLRPLGSDDGVRASLPGLQDKLLLVRLPSGEWARPGSWPSTHILKPQDMRLPDYARAEAFCLGLAGQLGLTSIEPEIINADGRPVIVVPRYDRTALPTGAAGRLHQEDACQALGIASVGKYEKNGRPSLRAFAKVLADHCRENDREQLLALTTLNVAVGNADCHAKNVSILHYDDGTSALAPAYDISPTTFYRAVLTEAGLRDMSDVLGMNIAGKSSIHKVATIDLIEEASSWGLARPIATRIVKGTLDTLRGCLGQCAESVGVIDPIAHYVEGRVRALSGGSLAGDGDTGMDVSEVFQMMADPPLRLSTQKPSGQATSAVSGSPQIPISRQDAVGPKNIGG